MAQNIFSNFLCPEFSRSIGETRQFIHSFVATGPTQGHSITRIPGSDRTAVPQAAARLGWWTPTQLQRLRLLTDSDWAWHNAPNTN
jgi:hypothetical protein